jgi:TDG/mug DNA glycosylase family protein
VTAETRPSPAELAAARSRTIPDVIGPGLRVLFCGINPGLYSGAVGHHFARPGNRFWKVLHAAGFTERVLSPFEDATLLERGLGITNLCTRTTARAEELTARELSAGAAALGAKVRRFRPRIVAVLGVGAYRAAFAHPHAGPGLQPGTLAGAPVWVLPNPSGLNAHYQVPELVERFRELHAAALGGRGVRGRSRPRSASRPR